MLLRVNVIALTFKVVHSHYVIKYMSSVQYNYHPTYMGGVFNVCACADCRGKKSHPFNYYI